ncbi:complement factor H-like [Sander vitreus]
MEGEYKILCNNGKWEKKNKLTCDRKNIPEADVISENKQRYRYYEQVQYRCKDGYQGQFTLTCRGDGWIGNPRCTENTECGETPVIPNGKLVTPQRQNLRHIQARITCNTGYSSQIGHLPCRGGKWIPDNISPKDICTPTAKHCKPPPKVENAVVRTSYQKEYLSNSAVTYQCRDGYYMEGEYKILCNNGKWEKKNVACTLTYKMHFRKSHRRFLKIFQF